MQKAIKKEIETTKTWLSEWQRCKPYIEKAIKHQDAFTIQDVEDKIRIGHLHLWPGEKSAMITEFVNLPQIKALNLLFCGGDFEELKKMLYYIEDFARNAGIKRLYGGGRQGWIRKLKGLGFKQEYLISKDL